ncbi:hypothetical protein ES703_07567 [subsurface metagenome]|nr:DUF4097 family beta strand repeat protein [bacterium]
MKKIALITLAALLVVSLGCYYADEASETATETYAADLYNRVEIETGNGEITSSVSSDSLITITLTKWVTGPSAKAHLDDIDVSVSEDTVNGTLSVSVTIPTSTVRNYGCDADIELPESLFIDFKTSNGKMRAAGHQNGLRLSSSNGRIEIAKTAGEADLFTSNGDIGVDRHTGDIAGETANGEIYAEVIMVKSAVDSKDTTYGYCRFMSSNGEITLAVPDSVGAQIRLRTSNGEISVDPDLPTQGDYNSDDDIYESKMGDESGEIDLETSNGDVTLKKLD